MKKGQYIPEKGYMLIIIICFYIIIGIAVAYITYKYVLRLILPFLIAWILSMIIHPLTMRISRKTGLSGKCVSFVIVSVMVFIVGSVVFYTIQHVISEIGKFIVAFGKNYDNIIDMVADTGEKLGKFLPFHTNRGMSEIIVKYTSHTLKSAVEYLSSKIPSIIGKGATAIPNFFMFTAMTVIALYYISSDLPKINDLLKRKLPKRIIASCRQIKENMRNSCLRYIKAYLLLMVITFLELLAGFLVLGIDYAFTIALLAAVADMLPVIGLGVILLPWAVIKFIVGDIYVGIGLVILYVVTAFIRQITEPKIVGKSIGLHPLITLVSMYIGLQLMGIIGMIVLPVCVIVVKNIYQSESKNASE